MLPGFRFLFAAIVLCFSILVFGLGAAALLRAAHEEFASKPSWRGTPETMFAQQSEASRPVLALLQVEPESKEPATDAVKEPAGEPVAPQRQDDTSSAAASPEPVASPSPAPETQQVAAQSAPENQSQKPGVPNTLETPTQKTTALNTPEETPQATAKSEPALPESAKTEDVKAASSLGEARATVEQPSSSPPEAQPTERETTVAASEDPTPKAVEPSPAPSEPKNTPAPAPQADPPQADPIGAKIAALGGSPEATDAQEPPKAANRAATAGPDKNAIRKRTLARRTKQRRRLAQRARVTIQHAAVQPVQPVQQVQQVQQPFLAPFVMEPGPNTQTH
jgi:hypothetical protein